MLLLNNQHLGMVVQWEDRFYERQPRPHLPRRRPRRGAVPRLRDPGQGLPLRQPAASAHKDDLDGALEEMLDSKGPYVLDVMVPYQEHVLPMIPSGRCATSSRRPAISRAFQAPAGACSLVVISTFSGPLASLAVVPPRSLISRPRQGTGRAARRCDRRRSVQLRSAARTKRGIAMSGSLFQFLPSGVVPPQRVRTRVLAPEELELRPDAFGQRPGLPRQPAEHRPQRATDPAPPANVQVLVLRQARPRPPGDGQVYAEPPWLHWASPSPRAQHRPRTPPASTTSSVPPPRTIRSTPSTAALAEARFSGRAVSPAPAAWSPTTRSRGRGCSAPAIRRPSR